MTHAHAEAARSTRNAAVKTHNMKIVVINEEEMRNIMSMKDAIFAVKEAASNYSAGKTDIPLRANLNVKEFNGNSLYMYGYVPGSKALGVKLVSVYPDNPKKGINACPATVILENAETGEVNAIIDGTYLTRLRTGALSGAATELLSRNDSNVFALIGTGGQAECQLDAVLAVRDIKEIRVYSRNIDNAKKFIERVSPGKTQKFVACKSSDAALSGDPASIVGYGERLRPALGNRIETERSVRQRKPEADQRLHRFPVDRRKRYFRHPQSLQARPAEQGEDYPGQPPIAG